MPTKRNQYNTSTQPFPQVFYPGVSTPISLFDKIQQLINNKPMDEIAEQFANNPDFQEFLNRQFDHIAVHATMEERAEFAFGSMEEAIEAFNQQQRKK